MSPDMEEENTENIACTLEMFTEINEVLEMIENLRTEYESKLEINVQRFTFILKQYQEQPHLLDKYLDTLLGNLIIIIKDNKSPDPLKHAAFKYMYIITNVRKYKVVVRHLSHEITDLEPLLIMLESQDVNDLNSWETRYMLLLWLSMIVMNPFHMSRLDSFSPENSDKKKTIAERIYKICQEYSQSTDSCFASAAFLSSKFLTRSDVKEAYLTNFFNWACEMNSDLTEPDVKYGVLASVATILKHGKREDLLPFSEKILNWIIKSNYKQSSAVLIHKYSIKIIQRIGLILLPPQIAPWRYQRGNRSLSSNLSSGDAKSIAGSIVSDTKIPEPEPYDDVCIPEQIEEVLEELIQGLRNCDGIPRWSAAKGIGRVVNRLPKDLGDEVLGSILELFSPRESHHAWHGGCLSLAELAKRGLLLPQRLPEIVPLVLQSLKYDVMQGFVSVGAHIRDAACYVSWAFARAYEASVLAPFTNNIAASLIATAVFDREINVRRAASAAFQENVGRLGTFPHGIEILTAADFYSVGMRVNSYLEISVYIAQFTEYSIPLIDHLINLKVNHWDSAIRELCAKALHRLTFKAPKYMSDCLPTLLEKTNSIDVNNRHGAILAIGEIILALALMAQEKNLALKDLMKWDIVVFAGTIVDTIRKRDQFKGIGGELMKQACCYLIEKLAKSNVPYELSVTDSWQELLEECLSHRVPIIRHRASSALPELLNAYYNSSTDPSIVSKRQKMIERFKCQLAADNEVTRMGFAIAIGGFPYFALTNELDIIINALIKCTKIEGQPKWAESRRDAVKALTSICQIVGANGLADYVEPVFTCLMHALGEYTIDIRGDIGAWVREAAMSGLHTLLTILVGTDHLTPEKVSKVMIGLAQQAVEKIDRTRAHAGKLFTNLIYNVPYVPHAEEVAIIFPPGCSEAIPWLFAQHTFPSFCRLLGLPQYSEAVMRGIIISVGDLAETLMKHSSASLFSYLKAQHSSPDELERLSQVIISVFSNNQKDDRISQPMLVFLDLLLSSGAMAPVLNNKDSLFIEEILTLTKNEIRGCKKIYKILASITVFCQLLQFDRVHKRALSQITVLLGHTLKHVRKTTASKFYEACIIYSECFLDSQDNLNEVMVLLMESDWDAADAPISEVRAIRNEVCSLLGIKPPIAPK